MFKSIIVRPLLTGLLVVLSMPLYPGCSAVKNLNLYSTNEEVEFGNQLDKEVVKEYEILDDKYLTGLCGKKGARPL